MREIKSNYITEIVSSLFIEANYILPDEIKERINYAFENENNPLLKNILEILKKNYEKAKEMTFPLCQDTGMAIVFAELGQEVHISGGYLIDSINNGVEKAYQDGYLRKSIVKDPFKRTNTGNNIPAIIHTEIIKGDKLKITVVPKGFGSENQSKIKMFKPTCSKDEIIDFIVKGAIESGSKGCPPCIIGIGIGGNFEYSAFLSKKALLISLNEPNPDPFYKEMEEQIMININKSGIGILGFGGNTTCLGVKILTYPTHIAGLPVAYNYCCHSCRHKSFII